MKKVSKIWLWLFLVTFGYSGGIITGVVVDVDTVYHTTVKKLKQKNSPDGTIVVDIDTDIEPEKTKKEIRIEKRNARKEKRSERNSAENPSNKHKSFLPYLEM